MILRKYLLLLETLPGDNQQATTNTWGWVNGYANNDEEYASFRLASLNYWPKLIENINNISSTSKGAFFGILMKLIFFKQLISIKIGAIRFL